MISKPNKELGFGLLEVLITLVLTAIGILGMVAMQSKSIQYTQQAVSRNIAASLSNDLMETLRGNRDALYDTQTNIKADSLYFKKDGEAFAAAESGCTSLDNACPLAQLQAWKQKVQERLPGVTDELLKSDFHICISKNQIGCSADGSAIEIRIAWPGRPGECPDTSGNDANCSYVLRAEI